MRYPFLVLSAALLSVSAAAASRDLVIKHDDLDLADPKAQKKLAKRIDAAAREYCKVGQQATGTRMAPAGASKCLEQARAAAREQMATLIQQSVALRGS